MSKPIALLVALLFITLTITGYHIVAAEVNDQNEHSQRSIDTMDSGARPLSSRLASAIQNTVLIDRDEDHANVELDKINDNHRYSLTTGTNIDADNMGQQSIDTNTIDRLLGRMLSRGETSRFVRSRDERKRSYRGLNEFKEDKDYSFIGDLPNKNVIDQQRIANLASRMLRDIILTDGERFYRASRTNGILPIRSFGAIFERAPVFDYFRGDRSASGQFSNQDLMDTNRNKVISAFHKQGNREKRRRCKVDPNLGVKNPSFCDTDAYFGAADYSMRDVWDSAGR